MVNYSWSVGKYQNVVYHATSFSSVKIDTYYVGKITKNIFVSQSIRFLMIFLNRVHICIEKFSCIFSIYFCNSIQNFWLKSGLGPYSAKKDKWTEYGNPVTL